MVLLCLAFQPLLISNASAKDQRSAVLLEATSLAIKSNGANRGSVTFQPGKEVEVVEDGGDKYKVAVAGLAEGWVDASKLNVRESPAAPIDAPGDANSASNTSETEEPNALSDGPQVEADNQSTEPTATPPAADAQLQPPPTPITNWANKKAKISATLTEKVLRVYNRTEASSCHGKKVDKVISMQIEGASPEELAQLSLKTYAVLTTEGVTHVLNNGVNEPAKPIEVMELKQKGTSPNTPTFNHVQTNSECSCCNDRKRRHLKGFYAELTAPDGTIVGHYASDLGRKDRDALEEYLGKKPLRNL